MNIRRVSSLAATAFLALVLLEQGATAASSSSGPTSPCRSRQQRCDLKHSNGKAAMSLARKIGRPACSTALPTAGSVSVALFALRICTGRPASL